MSANHQQPLQHPITTRIIRSAYSPRLRVPTDVSGPSRTKQEFKDECDINTIMARYQATGVLPHARDETQAYFADCTSMDFQSAMDTVATANSLFAELPAQIRDRFENDPAKLLAFVHDPRNRDESVEMGFLDPTKLPKGFGDLPPSSPTTSPSGAAPAASKQAAAAPTGAE